MKGLGFGNSGWTLKKGVPRCLRRHHMVASQLKVPKFALGGSRGIAGSLNPKLKGVLQGFGFRFRV